MAVVYAITSGLIPTSRIDFNPWERKEKYSLLTEIIKNLCNAGVYVALARS